MSLRARLALLVAGAVAVAVLIVIGLTYRAAAHQQREAFDDSLATQARATGARAALVVDLTSRFPRRVDPFAADDLLFQVLGREGLVRHPADQPELPVGEGDLAVARGEQSEAWSDVVVDGAAHRQLTVPLELQRSNRSGAVQLARPTGPVEDSLAGLRRRLLVVAGLGVAFAALLGVLVARRALRPVLALTETAEHVAATQELRSRIVVDRADELGRLAESFNAMLAALATSREQQQRLVTDASHELRTPLTSLRTNVELLQRADALPDGERRQIVDDAVREVVELSALVNELVDLATDARRAEESWGEVRLEEIVARAADRARRRHGVEVEVRVDGGEEAAGDGSADGVPTTVHGSEALLERAVTNLVDNAGKWSPPGGRVTVVVAPTFVPSADPGVAGPPGTRVTVQDQGPGVSAEDLPRLWDRFWRAPGSQDVPGSGLGLAIVRDVVEAHGGTAHADNAPDGGLVIGFTLPAPGTGPDRT